MMEANILVFHLTNECDRIILIREMFTEFLIQVSYLQTLIQNELHFMAVENKANRPKMGTAYVTPQVTKL